MSLNALTIALGAGEEAVVRELLAQLIERHAEVGNFAFFLKEEVAKFVTLLSQCLELMLENLLRIVELCRRVEALHRFVCFLVGGVHVTLVYPEHIRVCTVVGRFELGLILTDLLPFVITRLGLFSKYRLLL